MFRHTHSPVDLLLLNLRFRKSNSTYLSETKPLDQLGDALGTGTERLAEDGDPVATTQIGGHDDVCFFSFLFAVC